MNPRLTWHIFLKDASRLWWMIALTLALLFRLVHFDSLRDFGMPGTEEGWLNILLPLAWSFLIALVSLEDPVLGEAPFHATAPCRWQWLLAAKTLFIAVFIQLPYLIACVMIVQARGFASSDYLPALLYRQFALLAITLLSLALATVVRNVTQFMMIAIVLATAVAAPATGGDGPGTQHLREIFTLSVVTAAAVWIALAQYSRRLTSMARVVGIAAVLIAAVIVWLPRENFYGIQSALWPASTISGSLSIHPAETSSFNEAFPFQAGSSLVAIPIAEAGLTDHDRVRLTQSELTLDDGEGRSYSARAHRNLAESGPLFASLCCERELPTWQILLVDTGLLRRIGDSPIKLTGKALAQFHRVADPVRTSVGRNIPVAGFGRCSSDIRTANNPNDEMLHVDCESPNLPRRVNFTLTDVATGREWSSSAGSSYTFLSYPRGTWLSPVNRIDTVFLSTTEEAYSASRGPYGVPREILESVRIDITPEIPEGNSIVNYEIPNVRLNQFRVKP